MNPEFLNLRLSPAKRIDVSNKYGDHFWAMVLPQNYDIGKHYPLIITTYRDYGGFLRGGVGDEYPIQVFSANGFAVLNFEALGRVRNAKPNDFGNTILLWESPIAGVEEAVTKLADMAVIDRSRVGITGHSSQSRRGRTMESAMGAYSGGVAQRRRIAGPFDLLPSK